jgi:hypothetical protein
MAQRMRELREQETEAQVAGIRAIQTHTLEYGLLDRESHFKVDFKESHFKADFKEWLVAEFLLWLLRVPCMRI